MNVSNLNERQFNVYKKLVQEPIYTSIGTYEFSHNATGYEVFETLTGPWYDVLENDAIIVYDSSIDAYFFVSNKNDYEIIDVSKNMLDCYFYNEFNYKFDQTYIDSQLSDFLIKSLFNDSAFNHIVEKFFFDVEKQTSEVIDIVSLEKYVSLIDAAETKRDYVLRCRDLFFLCTTKWWENTGLDYAFDIFRTIWSKNILKNSDYNQRLIDLFKNVMHPDYFKNRELHIEGYIIQLS